MSEAVLSIYEIPLSATPQSMTIAIAGTSYEMTFRFNNVAVGGGGWAMDMADSTGNPILCGVPLVTGADLLGQYAYLGIGAALYVQTDGDPSAVPTFANLGTGSHVLIVGP